MIFMVIDYRIGLLFLVLMPIIPLFLKALLKFVTSMQGSYWKKYQDAGALFLDSLQGITALKIFGADKKRASEINDKSEDFRIEAMKILTMQLSSITLIEWIAYGSSIGCIFMSLYAFSKEGVSLESLIIVLILAMEAFNPMITLTASFHVAMTGVAAGKNLIEFLNLEEDRREEAFPEGGLESLVVKDLNFAYKDKEEKSLVDINMTLPQKGSIGLVGESGFGKSTLTKILAGSIRANSGDVFVNGHPFARINSNSIAEHIFRISHDSHIFEESVHENLTMGDKTLSDRQIEDALRKASILGYVEGLKEGLDTFTRELGDNFSSAQMQRLGLARCFLKDAQILLLDEPTSNLDSLNENIILT
ncbi:MAG: ATP-binding cassette domain-containing protein [Anaerococcus sp.]|nr:ATP-binding cassette domain-containing protein [Anaerococcus sp.]